MIARLRKGPGLRSALPLMAAACATAVGPAQARFTRIAIDSTTPLSGLNVPYETLRGRAFGELDPAEVHNAVITDLSLGLVPDGKATTPVRRGCRRTTRPAPTASSSAWA